MKRITLSIVLLLAMLIVANCTAVENLPSDVSAQATSIAETVVAGASTVQSAGETILTAPVAVTPPAQAMTQLAVPPEATYPPSITTICVPPIGWEKLEDLSLPNNLRMTASRDWVMLTDNDYKMKGAVQATETKSVPFAEQGVNIEVVLACGSVYFDPDTK